FSCGIAQAQGAEGVHALCLIAITQRAGRVPMVGAVPEGQSRHSPFAISAIAAVAIFAVTDQLLVRICEEMCGRESRSSWPRTGQSGGPGAYAGMRRMETLTRSRSSIFLPFFW